MRILILAAGIVMGVLALPATADTTLIYNTESNPLEIRVQPGAVRIDHAGASWQLYRHDENAIYTVYPEDKTYTRIDEDNAATIRNKLEIFRQRIEQRLADLPPKRRQLVRSALAEQLPMFSKKQQRNIVATDQTKQITDTPCRVLVVKQNNERVGSLCIAKRTALGLSRGGYSTIQSMHKLLHTALVEAGLVYRTLPGKAQSGIPIHYTGSVGTRTLLQVNHEALPDPLFRIPGQYQNKRVESGQ